MSECSSRGIAARLLRGLTDWVQALYKNIPFYFNIAGMTCDGDKLPQSNTPPPRACRVACVALFSPEL